MATRTTSTRGKSAKDKQAEKEANAKKTADAAKDTSSNKSDALPGNDKKTDDTKLNPGGISDEMLKKGEEEADKSGAEKNEELVNHDLGELTPAERREAGKAESIGEKLANCGAVFVETANGSYASRTPVVNSDDGPRMKILPISHVPPVGGMRVKDGDTEYAVPDTFQMDSKADDWLKVRNPSTGKPFIE